MKVGVKRFGEKGIKYFVLTRNDIAMKSVTATYMLNDSIGYIRIKNFGERTYAEMLTSLQQLNLQGADRLVIDLRDNSGGYLESAVQMAEEFLRKNQLLSIHKVARVHDANTAAVAKAAIRIFLW